MYLLFEIPGGFKPTMSAGVYIDIIYMYVISLRAVVAAILVIKLWFTILGTYGWFTRF